MALDAKSIGVFGINLSGGFDQGWVTLWRKDDHFALDHFEMMGDDDPVQDEPHISIGEGERIIACAIEQAHIDDWDAAYGADAEQIPGLTWTLDIDDLEQNDIALFSGNGGIPPRELFDALLDAIRIAVPGFASAMECLQ